MRLLLTLQYLGTRYAGWQSQANATAIQPIVEAALSKIFGSSIRIEGAGRTDAGVHARGQRAHTDVPFGIEPRGLVLGTNNLLPSDIRLTAAEEVEESFHARFAAKEKTYSYRVWNAAVADVFAAETHALVASPLDASVMNDAAQRLLGTHDFRTFTVAEPEISSTVRTLHAASVTREGSAVVLTITGNGFLRYMVRRIAGSLIEIGRDKLTAGALFAEARWTAPAKGLTLEEIRY
jgi:tRNA pseudouridine38-40 synthase